MARAQADYIPEETANDLTHFDHIELKKIIHGKFDPAVHNSFVKIDSVYCYKEMYMLSEAYDAFVSMANAAARDSIDLKIVSATRDFENQKTLWENKWTGKTKVDGKKLNLVLRDVIRRAIKILEYTAPPGFTRHHWGTDIDLNSVEPEYFETDEGIKVFQWLSTHAIEFGFCQTYPAKDENRPHGFNEEKWHWSYFPISKTFWENQISQFSSRNISDFKGANAVKKIKLLNYLTSINHCEN